jgi:hypothetical protein
MLIRGGVWLSDKLYPWLVGLSALAIAVSVFILLPLAVFKKTRGFSGMGFFIVSYVFGATLWVWSLLLTYVLWGGFALCLGLFLGGIGVLPIAMLATTFKGLWSLCGQLVVLAITTYATRVFGLYLSSKAEENTSEAQGLRHEQVATEEDELSVTAQRALEPMCKEIRLNSVGSGRAALASYHIFDSEVVDLLPSLALSLIVSGVNEVNELPASAGGFL